jgi:hypothetical protein
LSVSASSGLNTWKVTEQDQQYTPLVEGPSIAQTRNENCPESRE